MKITMSSLAVVALLGGAAAAQSQESVGDAAAGEKVFNQCQACHVVTDDAGNTLAGRAGRTGPNLYNVVGRTAGSVEGFRYSSSMVEAGEAGLVWEADTFVPYVQDPTPYLREYLDDKGARGAMTYKVRKEEDAKNVFACLKSLGSQGEGDGLGDASGS